MFTDALDALIEQSNMIFGTYLGHDGVQLGIEIREILKHCLHVNIIDFKSIIGLGLFLIATSLSC